MSFTEFTTKMVEELQKKAGEDFTIFTNNIRKNNGIELTGIIMKGKESNASPTIYIDDFYEKYQKGVSLEKIADAIFDIFQRSRCKGAFDISGFVDYEKARKNIAFKLVNYEKNWELLKEIPHRIFCNLAIVFYYIVKEHPFDGKATILIHNSHLQNWGIREEQLYQDACQNTPELFPAIVDSMEKVMRYMLHRQLQKNEDLPKEEEWKAELMNQFFADLESQPDKAKMYVLTNKINIMGAACMLYPGVLEKFADEIKSNFYILPSSIHEVILLPENEDVDKNILLEMVTEINRTQVEESEVLADAVYYYDKKTDKVERIA